MKPSFGSISRAGVLQTAQTLDQVGVFAGTLTGIGRLCDVIMTGVDGMMQATQSAFHHPRCLVFDGLYDGVVENSVQDAVKAVTSSLGTAVTHLPAPEMIASYLAGHKAVYEVELAQNLGAICDAKSALVGPAAKATVAIGRTHHSDVYDAAQAMRVRAIADLSSYFASYDVLITPAATSEAPLFDEGTGNPTCNALWSFVGFPCITLPLTTGPTGLPVGVQLIGAMGADKKLLQLAKWLLDTYHASRSA
jgi:Asp-tRNA(Asn)/Glu-tRNA(Gln) amidotransferase A subunit family amidase